MANPRRPPAAVLLVAVAVLALAAAAFYFLRPAAPKNALALSGRIEGDETDIGAKVGGRVTFVAVREGASVRRGQVLVRLDDAQTRAQLDEARARVTAARQQAAQAQAAVGVLESQLNEAGITVTQASSDASGRIAQARGTLAGARAAAAQQRAELAQAQASLRLAKIDRERFAQLVAGGDVSREQYDQADTTYRTTLDAVRAHQAALNASERQIESASGALAVAQTTGLNPSIRRAQAITVQRQIVQANAQIAAADAQVQSALASQREIEAVLDDLTVRSPIDGVVLTRSVEPGEVVAPGKVLLSAVDLRQVYLRGFVPDASIGRVRVGQKARVYLDSAPSSALDAHVEEIDDQASFTPENVYFREDRVQQVFGVKLRIANPSGFAKPGMPADGEILVGQSASGA
jgi:HlyD family secretion protein